MTRVAFPASSIGELWLLIMLLDFFLSFPSSSSVLCRLSAYFLLLQEQWNLYFKGGVCRAFNTPTDPEKSQAREMAKIIRLLSCLIIIIMIIIIIIITIIILY